MKKLKIIIALLIFFFFWGVWFCFVVWVIYTAKQMDIEQSTVNLHCQDENGLYQLVVPVEIGDNTYHFLWDTGASFSNISPFLADELELDMKMRTYVEDLQTVYTSVSDTFAIGKADIRIGDFFIDTFFFSDENYSIPYLNYKENSKIKGIIGQNIINRCYWLFDLENCEVTLSTVPFSLDVEDMEILVLPFTDSEGSVPHVDLKIDNGDSVNFIFDSGNQVLLDLADNTLYPSLRLYDSLFYSLDVRNKIYLELENKYKGVDELIVCDTLHLNDFRFKNFILTNLDTYRQENYITVNFIFQFNKMYYNPFDKEIKLIRNPYQEMSIDKIDKFLHYKDSLRHIMSQDPTIEFFEGEMSKL